MGGEPGHPVRRREFAEGLDSDDFPGDRADQADATERLSELQYIDRRIDEVTRLILDSHDATVFASIASLTVGSFRDFLLSDAATPEMLARIARGITLDHVSFAYPGSDRAVLQDVCLEVARGETLVITGATGSGKTTLLQLVPRLADVTSGRVLLDGTDVRDIPLPGVRAAVVDDNGSDGLQPVTLGCDYGLSSTR